MALPLEDSHFISNFSFFYFSFSPLAATHYSRLTTRYKYSLLMLNGIILNLWNISMVPLFSQSGTRWDSSCLSFFFSLLFSAHLPFCIDLFIHLKNIIQIWQTNDVKLKWSSIYGFSLNCQLWQALYHLSVCLCES